MKPKTPAQKKYGFCKLPPVDLSKVKIGQRLKMRSGEIAHLRSKTPVHSPHYPHSVSHGLGVSELTKEGKMYAGGEPHNLDIIAILPLPKRKVKEAKTLDVSQNRRSIKATIQNLKNAITHLEALL